MWVGAAAALAAVIALPFSIKVAKAMA